MEVCAPPAACTKPRALVSSISFQILLYISFLPRYGPRSSCLLAPLSWPSACTRTFRTFTDRYRISTGKKVFFLILVALAGCPEWPSPTQADSLSWTGLQWRNNAAMKGQWATSRENAMELLLDFGVEGFESLAGSSTVSFNLSVLAPEASSFQVHDVPLNETVQTMYSCAAMMLGVTNTQICIQSANKTYVNPTTLLSSLLVDGEVQLYVTPRDRVGGNHGEGSTEPESATDFAIDPPIYPPHAGRRRAEKQPDPTERPASRPKERWYCKGSVEHNGSGKARVGTWHPQFQDFTGSSPADVLRQREEWIRDFLHPKPRAAKTGARFAPTVHNERRSKRAATPSSMAEVRRSGPTTEQARAGPGRGHVSEPSAPSRLEEPIRIEQMKANANWLDQATARQVAPLASSK